jgi:hypothetical protein
MDYTFLDNLYLINKDLFNEVMHEIYYNMMFKKIWF